MTEEEERALRGRAMVAGVSVPRLLVEAALGGGVQSEQERFDYHATATELLRLRRQVGGIATNINQLAAKANATGEFPHQAGRAVAEAREMLRELHEVMGVLVAGRERRVG